MGLFSRKKNVPIRQPHITGQNESYSFRRSRTLTGSSADSVRSASENRAQIKSPRIHAHELRSHRRKLFVYLCIVLAMAFAGWSLLNQYTGHIPRESITTVPAGAAVDKQPYVNLLNEYFGTYPLERFRFALRESTLQDFLRQKAPEVAAMELASTGQLGEAQLTVTFRQPVVVWEIARQKYYVDADGHAFRKNYYPEPPVVVKDQSGINPAEGAIASNRFLHFLGRVVALVDQSGVAKVNGVIIPPNTTREVDLQFTGRTTIIKTQLDRDPAGQVTDILNAIRYLDARGINPRYIDVRVSSKAFYQ